MRHANLMSPLLLVLVAAKISQAISADSDQRTVKPEDIRTVEPPVSEQQNKSSDKPPCQDRARYIEILGQLSYADDRIVSVNLRHNRIFEVESDAFVGQRFELIDLSSNRLGLIRRNSFRIGLDHLQRSASPKKRPPAAVTIDLSNNPAVVALPGAFDHIHVPNCLLNFTNSTVDMKFGAFKRYFMGHPGHLVEIDSVDCCEHEWLLSYKHNFASRTHCEHDPRLILTRTPQQTIVDSCIAHMTSAEYSAAGHGQKLAHQPAPRSRHQQQHDNQPHLNYLILGGTAMVLTSLSIYIIFYMITLKAAFVDKMQQKC